MRLFPRIFRLPNPKSLWVKRFMARYIYEYTFGDKDGFPTCGSPTAATGDPDPAHWGFKANTSKSVAQGITSNFPASTVKDAGMLCGCDPNDASATTKGTCNTQSAAAPVALTTGAGVCQKQTQRWVGQGAGVSDGCGGTVP